MPFVGIFQGSAQWPFILHQTLVYSRGCLSLFVLNIVQPLASYLTLSGKCSRGARQLYSLSQLALAHASWESSPHPFLSRATYILASTMSGAFPLDSCLGILLTELALAIHSELPQWLYLSCGEGTCRGICWGALLLATEMRDVVECITQLPSACLLCKSLIQKGKGVWCSLRCLPT